MYDSAIKENIQHAELGAYTYLHFATHGLMNEANPDLSGILLTSNSGSDENSILFASEIYNLNLNSELVTLSACETGLGKISKGEGVIGLSRALIYAGARGCMVSLWKVADEATASLMKRYYATLIDSPKRNLSATLQEAKNQMLTDGTHSSPYYWASFILIGY
jgi:CHAT domain-containing protein